MELLAQQRNDHGQIQSLKLIFSLEGNPLRLLRSIQSEDISQAQWCGFGHRQLPACERGLDCEALLRRVQSALGEQFRLMS